MLGMYKTDNGIVHKISKYEPDCWISLTAPTREELDEVAMEYAIEIDDIQAALDVEETSRIIIEDNYTLILVDVPANEIRNEEQVYTTIPLGMIVTDQAIITVCMENTHVLSDFVLNKIKQFSTKKRMRFVYQILFRAASIYQRSLRYVDKHRREIESRYQEDYSKIDDMVALHELETTLVYFETSLRGNESVLNRLKLYKNLDQYAEDEELLDDVIIENRQAIEMAIVYKDIVSGTANLISTILDSRLNNAMKFLTSISLVTAIPTIVSGIYGMNIALPLASLPYAFEIIIGTTVIVCVIVMIFLHHKDML